MDNEKGSSLHPDKEDPERSDQIFALDKPIEELLNGITKFDAQSQIPSVNLLNWVFPISAGTLIWMMSSTDKFKIANMMPNKDVYLLSYYLILISSVILGSFQSYIYYINYYLNTNKTIENIKQEFEELKDQKASYSPEVFNDHDIINYYKDYLESLSTVIKRENSQHLSNTMKTVKRINSVSQPLILAGSVSYCFGILILAFYFVNFLKLS
jgi:hypothetical protein